MVRLVGNIDEVIISKLIKFDCFDYHRVLYLIVN